MPSTEQDRDQLAYALVTPYSLHKSRTGGILARLLWANVRLVAARMYAPRPDGRFIRDYCDAIYDPQARAIPLRFQKLLIEYIVENFGEPNLRGISNRMLLLVFRGPDAIRDITEAVGHISQDVRGDSVRGTFGDFVLEERSGITADQRYRERMRLLGRYTELQKIELPARRDSFFEPAVLTGVNAEMTERHLNIFRKYAYSDGGFVLHALGELQKQHIETSMVLLKPESFRHRNPLPGNLIDFFARTGMFITAAKLLRMSVEEAGEFYSLKLPQFTEQLKGMVEGEARRIVQKARELAREAVRQLGADPERAYEVRRALAMARKAEELYRGADQYGPGDLKKPVLDRLFEVLERRLENLEPDDSVYAEVAEGLKEFNARVEFGELIKYVTGRDPCTGQLLESNGEAVCLAILYSGRNALATIRKRLKELRVIYGKDILQNRAHASDPQEDPLKEMKIVGMPNVPEGESRPCDVEEVVTRFYGGQQ